MNHTGKGHVVSIKVLDHAKDLPMPVRATTGSAGFDLRAAVEDEISIKPGEYRMISTGIAIEMEPGLEAQIRPRSGLAVKHGITVLNSPGTIDSDYRGEIKVCLINHSKTEFTLSRGERICQMVIVALPSVELKFVEEISDSDRGEGGFGSTGKN